MIQGPESYCGDIELRGVNRDVTEATATSRHPFSTCFYKKQSALQINF
jgi:hypothetical protein